MKLTEKDKEFLENLKKLMESKELWVGLKPESRRDVGSDWMF